MNLPDAFSGAETVSPSLIEERAVVGDLSYLQLYRRMVDEAIKSHNRALDLDPAFGAALNSLAFREATGWNPTTDFSNALKMTADWYREYFSGPHA